MSTGETADRLMMGVLSRIPKDGQLHQALSNPQDMFREFAVAITAAVAHEFRGASAPTAAGAPLISDIEARQVEAYITESLTFPEQGDGRLAKDIMVALSVLMTKVNAVDATARSVARLLHASFRGSDADLDGMDEANLRAHLRQMVEARGVAIDSLSKIALQERDRPVGQ